jgi:hypothetical protein
MAGLGSINFRIGADLAEFRSAMQNVDRTLGGLSSKFNAVGGMIAGAFAVNGIQQLVTETSRLAGQADGVRVAFQRMAPAGMLDELRKATRGTVSDLELMQNAVKAGNFGIPLKEMGTLLEFASRRAQETGDSVDYLVQSIVTGIGRKSPMILDNLGISTSRLKAEFNGAAIEAQSIADVTAAVSKIAKEEMSKAGTATITAADAAAQVTAQMNNLQVAIGDRLNQSMGPFLSSLGSTVGFFTDLVAIPLSDKYEDEAAAVAGLTVELTSADTAMERRRDILNYLNSKYPGYLENIDLEKTSMTDLAAATAKLNGELINRIVIQRQQEKIDKANEKVATKAESLAQSRIKLAAAVAKLEGDLNIKKTEGLTLEDRAQNAMAISIDNAKKYRKATSGMFAQHNDVRAYYNAVVAGERNLQFEQDKVNNAIADRNAVMKELGITEEKAQQIASIGAASTREQTKETQVSTEAKRKDIDELGRSADSMHDLKLAVSDLFDTIAKEGTLDEGLEIKNLVSSLKDGEKAAKKMNAEMISAIGTYDLEPLTAEQAALNEGVENTVELLDGKLSPAFNFVANNMETVNHLIGQFGSMFATAFESAFDSMKSKTEIIDYLNANYGEYLENVNLEKMSISELSKATEKLNDETLRGMLLDAERQKFFPALMKMLGDMIKKLIAAALAAAALAAAITIAFGGNFANIGKLFGGADSFGKLFGSMFGGMSGIPGLAEGGIVTGPTLAMVGEGRGPEAVIPLDRLHEFAGGGVQVYGRIQGSDILLSSERADRVRSRYRGF